MSQDVFRILGFAGSLRRYSYNRGLIRAAKEVAPQRVEIEVFDLIRIPLYNSDVEAQGTPSQSASSKNAYELPMRC